MTCRNIFSKVNALRFIPVLFLAGSLVSNAQNYGFNSATGNVKGRNYVGGLTGRVAGADIKLHNSYARGTVEGADHVGGLAGQNSGRIENSYATGRVTTAGQKGGLAGSGSGTVTGSYWDIQTTGQTASAGGLGRNTDPMTHPYATDTYTGWDFNQIWQADPTPYTNNGYPYLKAATAYRISVQVYPPGSGTVSGEGIYPANGSAQLAATPGTSWKFQGWFAGSETLGVSENLTFKVNQNVMLVARFVDKSTSTGIGFAGREFKMELYPNPARDRVWIRTGSPGNKITSLSVLDVNGRKVMEPEKETLSGETISIPLSGLPPGIYIVVARFPEGVASGKVVKY